MVAGMKLATTAMCCTVLAGAAQAQDLGDPMQPSMYAPAGAAGSGLSGDQGLQAIILSQGRRLAVINGKVYKVGEQVGEARLLSISAGEVTLRDAGKTRVLKLVPESVGKISNDEGGRPRARTRTPDRSGDKG